MNKNLRYALIWAYGFIMGAIAMACLLMVAFSIFARTHEGMRIISMIMERVK